MLVPAAEHSERVMTSPLSEPERPDRSERERVTDDERTERATRVMLTEIERTHRSKREGVTNGERSEGDPNDDDDGERALEPLDTGRPRRGRAVAAPPDEECPRDPPPRAPPHFTIERPAPDNAARSAARTRPRRRGRERGARTRSSIDARAARRATCDC